MEKELLIELLVIQIFTIVTLIAIILLLVKTRHNIFLDKKFSKYTINPIKNKNIPFFDKVNGFARKIIKKNSKILSNLKIFDKYASRYERHINYEEMKLKKPMDYISIKFIIAFLLIILYLLAQTFQYSSINIIGLFLSFIIGFFAIDVYIIINYRRKRKKIEEDLLKAIIIMNNSFASGRSMTQSIEIVKDELDGPISDEFKKIYLDISYGLSLEVVFDRFYNRVKIEDVKYITSSLTLLNKTGGNIVKVFEAIEKEFFNKKKLNNELKMMTSSSMFVFRVLLVLPFILYALIFILNREYFNPLFNNLIGIVILLLIFLLYILYVFLIKRIMKVDV